MADKDLLKQWLPVGGVVHAVLYTSLPFVSGINSLWQFVQLKNHSKNFNQEWFGHKLPHRGAFLWQLIRLKNETVPSSMETGGRIGQAPAKMSNPQERGQPRRVVEQVADTLCVYEMSMGPLDHPWSEEGLEKP